MTEHRPTSLPVPAVVGMEIIGGKSNHPVCGLPGGMSRPITEQERQEIITRAKRFVEFGKFSLQIFEDIVLKNKEYVDIITGGIYYMKTYYMGLVDENNKVNLYDGDIKVIDPDGPSLSFNLPLSFRPHGKS